MQNVCSIFSPGLFLILLRSAISMFRQFLLLFLHLLFLPHHHHLMFIVTGRHEVSGSPWFRGKPYSCIKGSRNRLELYLKTGDDDDGNIYVQCYQRYQNSSKKCDCNFSKILCPSCSNVFDQITSERSGLL